MKSNESPPQKHKLTSLPDSRRSHSSLPHPRGPATTRNRPQPNPTPPRPPPRARNAKVRLRHRRRLLPIRPHPRLQQLLRQQSDGQLNSRLWPRRSRRPRGSSSRRRRKRQQSQHAPRDPARRIWRRWFRRYRPRSNCIDDGGSGHGCLGIRRHCQAGRVLPVICTFGFRR